MDFAIEVPGEANPLNQQNLQRIIAQASSNDQQQVKTGTQQLTNWEKLPGFYSSLQSTFLNKSLPIEVRYLCAIQIKNGIDKYWRKTATNAVSRNEKDLIRSRCIDAGIKESDHRLLLQNALVVAKIVRHDYPHDWPDAIGLVLTEIERAQSDEELSRCLLILLYIIKELATGRLQRNRTNLQSAAPNIFRVVATKYIDHVSEWMDSLTSSENMSESLMPKMQQSLCSIRILRRLLVAGYQHPNRDNDVAQFWAIMTEKLQQMLSWLVAQASDFQSGAKSVVEKHVMQFSKLHLDMARSSPAGFTLLPGSTDLARSYWALIRSFGQHLGLNSLEELSRISSQGDKADEVTIIEKISLKGLLILRACAKMVFDPAHTFRFRHPQDKEEEKRSREIIRLNLFTDAFAHEIMETMVTKFFVFRPRDLREWQDEPDEWERREEGEGDVWEFSVRSCAEKLFLDVMINYKDLLVQPLLKVFGSVASKLVRGCPNAHANNQM